MPKVLKTPVRLTTRLTPSEVAGVFRSLSEKGPGFWRSPENPSVRVWDGGCTVVMTSYWSRRARRVLELMYQPREDGRTVLEGRFRVSYLALSTGVPIVVVLVAVAFFNVIDGTAPKWALFLPLVLAGTWFLLYSLMILFQGGDESTLLDTLEGILRREEDHRYPIPGGIVIWPRHPSTEVES